MTAVAKYADLGLVNTKSMFMKAMKDRYAIPAYNFNHMEQLQAIIMACSKSKSLVILKCSGSAIKSPGDPDLFKPLVDSLLYHDEYLLFADYQSYVDCQDSVSQTYRDQDTWTRCQSSMQLEWGSSRPIGRLDSTATKSGR